MTNDLWKRTWSVMLMSIDRIQIVKKRVMGPGQELVFRMGPDVSSDRSDVLNPETEDIAKAHDDYFWPHKEGCSICGSDAYVGFATVECSNTHCQNWRHREGM